MTCEQADTFIESIAVGDSVPEELAAHVAACRHCAVRVALARQIDRMLQERTVPMPPPGFTTSVVARLRQERWRTEQLVDISFNIAVAAGVLLIMGGIAGLAWGAGAFAIASDVAALIVPATRTVLGRAATNMQLVTAVMLLISTAIGLWWWAEEDTV
jgi:anti-sigma factor RsiW